MDNNFCNDETVNKILVKLRDELEEQEIFLSEDDFKFSFAQAAINSGMQKVILEFPIMTKDLYSENEEVKKPFIESYEGKLTNGQKESKYQKDRSYIDVFFMNGKQEYFIELKYKIGINSNKNCTNGFSVSRHSIKNFPLKNQGAADIGMYLFHEDLERMEFQKKRKPESKCFCILITNDSSYWTKHDKKRNETDCQINYVSIYPKTKNKETLKNFEMVGAKRKLQVKNEYETEKRFKTFKILENIPKEHKNYVEFKSLVVEIS